MSPLRLNDDDDCVTSHSSMAELVLHLPEIEAAGSKKYSFALTVEWLAEQLAQTEFRAPKLARLELEAKSIGDDVVVSAVLSVTLVVPCARCNDDLDMPLELSFAHMLSARPQVGAVPEELELTPEDLDREYFSGDRIVLDILVRDQMLLAVPMRPLHDDGDCDPEIMARLGSPREGSDRRPSPFAALLKEKK